MKPQLCLLSPTCKHEEVPPLYIGNPSTSCRTSHLQSWVDDSYLPRGQGGFLALTLARATLSQLAGGITFLLVLSPVRSPIFTVMSPFLSPGGSRLVRAESLDFCPTLCLCEGGKKSDHEMGLKFSVYHGSRTPNLCPVAFCFQMKMLCATEELQRSVYQGSRE